MAVPNIGDVLRTIDNYKARLGTSIENRINILEKRLDALKNSYVLKNPLGIYEVKEQKLSSFLDRLQNSVNNTLINSKLQFEKIVSKYVFKHPEDLFKNKVKDYDLLLNKLELLNPLGVLKKGYAVVSFNGNNISDVTNVKMRDIIDVKFNRGKLKAEVKEIINDGKQE